MTFLLGALLVPATMTQDGASQERRGTQELFYERQNKTQKGKTMKETTPYPFTRPGVTGKALRASGGNND